MNLRIINEALSDIQDDLPQPAPREAVLKT